MGLDIYMKVNDCIHCNRHDETDNIYITYNLSSMWKFICPEDNIMINIDEMTGSQSLDKLEISLQLLLKNKDTLENLNPPNGWGSYKVLCESVQQLISIAKQYPNDKWIVSR